MWVQKFVLCVEQGQALGVALHLAAQVARQSPAAVRYCKELIQGGRDQPINTLLARERERFVDLFELEDTVEGVNAFLEKRPPQWTRR